MTALVVSAQEAAEKTGRECKVSQFWDRPRHATPPMLNPLHMNALWRESNGKLLFTA